MSSSRVLVLLGAVLFASCNARGVGGPAQLPDSDGNGNGYVTPEVEQIGKPPRWRVFKTPSGVSYHSILADPTGKYMWLTDSAHDSLVRMTMSGETTAFPLKSPKGTFSPGFFAFASDGAIDVGGCIGTDCGIIGILSADHKHFTVVHTPSGDGPGTGNGFVLGPDKNVWFVESKHVARITLGHAIREYESPTIYLGPNIIVGGDGRLWFDGTAGSYDCPNAYWSSQCPFAGNVDPATGNVLTIWLYEWLGSYYAPASLLSGGMALGSNGNVFVLAQSTHGGGSDNPFYADELTPNGGQQTSVFLNQLYSPASNTSVTAGPDGNIWWGTGVYRGNHEIGALANLKVETGAQNTFKGPEGLYTYGVTLTPGGDGNIWMIASSGDVLVYVLKTLLAAPKSLTFSAPGKSHVLQITYRGNSSGLSAESLKPTIATVTRKGPRQFTVEAVKAGSTTIVIQDTQYNSFDVPVTVN